MFEGNSFYFSSIRKVVVGFGTLFNSVSVTRTDNDSADTKTLTVPFSYAPREHYIAKLRDATDGVQTSLPRMSYEMTGLTYDITRKLATTGYKKAGITGSQELYKQLNPAPYTLNFDLNIFARTIDEALQIVEQIVPYFTPDQVITIKEIPELGIERDIPITLESVVQEDNYQGAVEETRMVTWVLSFTAKAYLYPPIKQSKVILQSIIDIKESSIKTDEIIDVSVDPPTANVDEEWTAKTVITEV